MMKVVWSALCYETKAYLDMTKVIRVGVSRRLLPCLTTHHGLHKNALPLQSTIFDFQIQS